MVIYLTDNQVQDVLSGISKKQFLDYLKEDVAESVDWICEFIHGCVESEELQNKIKQSFPPVQMKLFND